MRALSRRVSSRLTELPRKRPAGPPAPPRTVRRPVSAPSARLPARHSVAGRTAPPAPTGSRPPVTPAQHPGQFGLVVGGLAEAAEDGGHGAHGTGPVPADVTDDGPHTVLGGQHTVLGGQHLVQIATDPGSPVGGQVDRGDGQSADPRRWCPQQRALRGLRDPARPPQLAQQSAPYVHHQTGDDRAQDGAADQTGAEGVVVGQRAGQPVGDRGGAPADGHHEGGRPREEPGRDPAGSPRREAEHADGPHMGPDSADRPREAGPILSTA